MPKRKDLHKILIIGSGPTVIGQAGEFDYSGQQACKALKELGYKTVYVNSNPAATATCTETADVTYIEPLNAGRVEQIIAKERPDALLPNMSGESGINLCKKLVKSGIPEKYGVEFIGLRPETVENCGDKVEFKKLTDKLGEDTLPAGGLADWKELEVEIIRDSKNQTITACFIENIDTMGINSGDSCVVTPMQTVNDEIKNRIEDTACRIVNEMHLTGVAGVKFALDSETGKTAVAGVTPGASLLSAFASKAEGIPAARISAMLAAGITLDEIPCSGCGTLDKFKPVMGHVAVGMPRWAFDKLKDAGDVLDARMKSVGQVMAIGKSFKESFQKAVRSLETGRFGLGFVGKYNSMGHYELLGHLEKRTSERYFIIYEAVRHGATADQIHEITNIDYWFIQRIKELAEEEKVIAEAGELNGEVLAHAKKDGFSDVYLARVTGLSEDEIRTRRISAGIIAGSETAGPEESGCYYSTYGVKNSRGKAENSKKIMILGSGPERIGQGNEFDCNSVRAALALKDMGYETVMVNSNPGAVSTGRGVCDTLYIDPVTAEDVLGIYEREKPAGVITQFGGKTALALTVRLEREGARIIGTGADALELMADRDRLREVMDKLRIPVPENGTASTVGEALEVASRIGYPVTARPARSTEDKVIHDADELSIYMLDFGFSGDKIIIDSFLQHARVCEADAVCDGKNVFVPAVIEHIEQAGIHSGDSACVIPPVRISRAHSKTVEEYTKRIAASLGIRGLVNIQYAIENGTVYMIKVTPCASRTAPLVSQVCGVDIARTAVEAIMPGSKSALPELKQRRIPYYGVKEAVLPFKTFPEVDPVLGPEMRSTGAVLGLSDNFGEAFYKAQEAAQTALPQSGAVLISVADQDKEEIIDVARSYCEMGFEVLATHSTYLALRAAGIDATYVTKVSEGPDNVLDAINSGKVKIVVNTPQGKLSSHDGSYIRRAVIRADMPYNTTVAAAIATVEAIRAARQRPGEVRPLQKYYKSII